MTPHVTGAGMRKPAHLDLFSGIGGFSIAAEACGFETVAFCEIDPEANFVTGHFWPHVPNLYGIRTLSRDSYPHRLPDLITGGVPCQPASALGLMRGTSDERWLWPDTIRVMRELRPRYGCFENPPAILTLEQGDAWNGIVSGLVACGYDLWWDVFPAAAFGAGHLRERVILVCSNTESGKDRGGSQFAVSAGRETPNQSAGNCRTGDAADSDRERRAEARNGVSSRASGGSDIRRQPAAHDSEASTPDTNRTRLQGHAGLGENGDESRRVNTGPKLRYVAPPDLRGRVTGSDWWHEAHTGIPVLATGIPSRVVEAVSRCIGNSVVPQVLMPIMEALTNTLPPPQSPER